MNIKKELITAIKVFIGFAVILGIIYPLCVTGIAQLTMKDKANGSLIEKDGKVIGSILIGQKFDTPEYFNSRPSAVDYNASSSGASNLGPTSKKLIEQTQNRINESKQNNNINNNTKIPADMVLASASGLDPHISIENAKIQADRIAKIRRLKIEQVNTLISKNIDDDFLGLWGQKGVNVLKLNIALDNKSKQPKRHAELVSASHK